MRGLGGLILRRLAFVLIAVALATAAWVIVLEVLDITPLVGKRPVDVWEYLTIDPDAAANRDALLANLLITLRDAGVGYLIGLLLGFAAAVVFTLSSAIEKAVMPGIIVLRSVPLLIMTPIITLMFGVNLVGVTVIVTTVVFFPTLINIAQGLRGANPQHVDIVRAYGGSTWTVVRKVSLASALPALLASARLSVPMAVTGAMIGEWLATGEGLGGSISRASGSFGYDEMWSSAVVITVVTMLVYSIVSVIDALVLDRFGSLGEG